MSLSNERIATPLESQLLALVVRKRSGREIAQRFMATQGRAIAFGTLYTTLRRLADEELVEIETDPSEGGDKRVRYFEITGAGTAALNRAKEYYLALALYDPDARLSGSVATS